MHADIGALPPDLTTGILVYTVDQKEFPRNWASHVQDFDCWQGNKILIIQSNSLQELDLNLICMLLLE